MNNEKYVIYLLECADGSLYCGITNDMEKRLKAHNSGRGAKYTKGRGPCRLAYLEEAECKGDALRREAEIKRLPRAEKLKMVEMYGAEDASKRG